MSSSASGWPWLQPSTTSQEAAVTAGYVAAAVGSPPLLQGGDGVDGRTIRYLLKVNLARTKKEEEERRREELEQAKKEKEKRSGTCSFTGQRRRRSDLWPPKLRPPHPPRPHPTRRKKKRKKVVPKTWRRPLPQQVACRSARVGMRLRRQGHGFALALRGSGARLLFWQSLVWCRAVRLARCTIYTDSHKLSKEFEHAFQLARITCDTCTQLSHHIPLFAVAAP